MATEAADRVTMDKIVALCKRRGFIFQSSEIYGGLASTYDYGHYGVLLKSNVRSEWWRAMVQQRDSGLSETLGSPSRVESLRCDVQQLDFAAVHTSKPVRDLSRGEGAVDESSGQPARGQRVDLIFHQRDERRHYHSQAGKNQRGHLKAERLSAAGGQNDDGIAPSQNSGHSRFLTRSEVVVAKGALEESARILDCRFRHRKKVT